MRRLEINKDIVNSEKDYRCGLYDDKYHGANSMAERLRPKINSICERQGIDLPTQQIIFLYDWKPYMGGDMGHTIQLSQITRELLYQITGCFYTVAIRLNKEATSRLQEAQISNVLYHCLRHLRVNDKTGELEVVSHHAVEEWPEQVAFAEGKSYAKNSPNLFDVRIFPRKDEAEQTDNPTAAAQPQSKSQTNVHRIEN